MPLIDFALVFLTAVCMAVANLLIKQGILRAEGFTLSARGVLWQPAFIGGVLLTAAGALMWFRILATQKLSTCYPLFVSLTYFLITALAFYFLHEKISVQKLVGLAVIIVGITAVARG